MGGVMVSSKVGDMMVASSIRGYTYSGHPTCAAQHLFNTSPHQTARTWSPASAATSASDRWAKLDITRWSAGGRGLMGALELVPAKPSRSRSIKGQGRHHRHDLSPSKNGLIMRAVRDSLILSPP